MEAADFLARWSACWSGGWDDREAGRSTKTDLRRGRYHQQDGWSTFSWFSYAVVKIILIKSVRWHSGSVLKL